MHTCQKNPYMSFQSYHVSSSRRIYVKYSHIWRSALIAYMWLTHICVAYMHHICCVGCIYVTYIIGHTFIYVTHIWFHLHICYIYDFFSRVTAEWIRDHYSWAELCYKSKCISHVGNILKNIWKILHQVATRTHSSQKSHCSNHGNHRSIMVNLIILNLFTIDQHSINQSFSSWKSVPLMLERMLLSKTNYAWQIVMQI